jgi:hypothetical protein
MSRMEAKYYDEATVDALRQKEKMRIINIATQQILNSLSSRIQQLNK